MSRAVTWGRVAVRRSVLRVRARKPSPSISLSRSLNGVRMSPWMPKYFARSRLPSRSGRAAIASMIASRVGSVPTRYGRAGFGLERGFILSLVVVLGAIFILGVIPAKAGTSVQIRGPVTEVPAIRGNDLVGKLGLHFRLGSPLGCRFLRGRFLGRRLLCRRLLRWCFGGSLAGGSLASGLAGPLGDQLERLLERDLVRLHRPGQGRIDLTLVHIGPVAAVADRNRAIGMLERFDCGDRRLVPAEASAAGGLLRQEVDRAVEPDREHLLDIGEVGVGAFMQNERSVAADARADRLPRFRVKADRARQRQQFKRSLEREAVGRPALGQ